MPSKRITNYIIIFNIVMSVAFILFSQLVLSELVSTNQVVRTVGLTVETQYIGPIELTPTGSHAPLWNYPLFVFIFTLIGNANLNLATKKRSKTNLHSKIALAVETFYSFF